MTIPNIATFDHGTCRKWSWIRIPYKKGSGDTLDGLQICRTNWGKVVYPVIYEVLPPSKRWLALGFLNHQQYGVVESPTMKNEATITHDSMKPRRPKIVHKSFFLVTKNTQAKIHIQQKPPSERKKVSTAKSPFQIFFRFLANFSLKQLEISGDP